MICVGPEQKIKKHILYKKQSRIFRSAPCRKFVLCEHFVELLYDVYIISINNLILDKIFELETLYQSVKLGYLNI